MFRSLTKIACAGLLGLAAAGCGTNAGNGALIGGAGGAGLGAIVGHNSHGHTAGGALVGGALGAIAGGLIGGEADRQEHERDAARYDRYQDRYYDRDSYRDSYYARPRYTETRTYGGDGYYEYRTYRSYGPYGETRTYVERRYDY